MSKYLSEQYSAWAMKQPYDAAPLNGIQHTMMEKFSQHLCLDLEYLTKWMQRDYDSVDQIDLFLLSWVLGDKVWGLGLIQDRAKLDQLAKQMARYRGNNCKEYLIKTIALVYPDKDEARILSDYDYWDFDSLAKKSPAWMSMFLGVALGLFLWNLVLLAVLVGLGLLSSSLAAMEIGWAGPVIGILRGVILGVMGFFAFLGIKFGISPFLKYRYF